MIEKSQKHHYDIENFDFKSLSIASRTENVSQLSKNYRTVLAMKMHQIKFLIKVSNKKVCIRTALKPRL